MLHPPKRHVCLKFSVEKKAFYFSKRVLRRGTARSVLVKISPVVCLFECERLYFKLWRALSYHDWKDMRSLVTKQFLERVFLYTKCFEKLTFFYWHLRLHSYRKKFIYMQDGWPQISEYTVYLVLRIYIFLKKFAGSQGCPGWIQKRHCMAHVVVSIRWKDFLMIFCRVLTGCSYTKLLQAIIGVIPFWVLMDDFQPMFPPKRGMLRTHQTVSLDQGPLSHFLFLIFLNW